LGTERVDLRFTFCYIRNIGIAFSKYFVDENKYIMGGVAMFSLHTIKNNINIAVYKI